MPEIIKRFLIVTLLLITINAHAHEDDYLMGLSAFRDGLYELSIPGFETYLAGETTEHKKNYSNYLLYRIYFSKKDYESAYKNIQAIEGVDDRRFDRKQTDADMMLLYGKYNCDKAANLLMKKPDSSLLDFYLDSECEPSAQAADVVLKVADSDNLKMKAVLKFSGDKEVVAKIFDSMDISKISDKSKRYFAFYFYKREDFDRFWKVSEVYEDGDIASLQLDRFWNVGDKESFINSFERIRGKYEPVKANSCRAISIYRANKQKFDCDIIDECLNSQTIKYATFKSACILKEENADKFTKFVDSLKGDAFAGVCAYSEYIFQKGAYKGKGEARFYVCDNRHKIGRILLSKKEFQKLVNIFFNKDNDMDRFYAAAGLAGLGKQKAAIDVGSKIKDANLRKKLGMTK